jgi:putative endonuclease
MANDAKTIYFGSASNLFRRISEHKGKVVDGFTKQYNLTKLVFYEVADTLESARERERQIKGWRRSRKIELVESQNPGWLDLYPSIVKAEAR